MKTSKPDLDSFIHGGAAPVLTQQEPKQKTAKPQPKKTAVVAKPAKAVKPAAPAPQKTEKAKVETVTVSRIVKFPLELPEDMRKAVKRHVVDLDKVSMNEYMVQAIREKLKSDGIDL